MFENIAIGFAIMAILIVIFLMAVLFYFGKKGMASLENKHQLKIAALNKIEENTGQSMEYEKLKAEDVLRRDKTVAKFILMAAWLFLFFMIFGGSALKFSLLI